MTDAKVRMLARIEAQARGEAEVLAGEFARAASGEREEILAALETERWLAEACANCRPTADRCERDGFSGSGSRSH